MATYHVKTDGNDGLDGLSEENAWLTLDKANGEVAAGDTVEIYPGTYTGNSNRIYPEASGGDGNRITYIASDTGDKPVVRSNTTSPSMQFLSTRSYITVSYIDFSYAEQADCLAENVCWCAGDYITIDHCDFANGKIGGAGDDLNFISFESTSSYCVVSNSTFDTVGQPEEWGGGNNGTGNEIKVESGASYHLIENNTLATCGHNPILVYGNHCVVRGNTVTNEDWGKGIGVDDTTAGNALLYNVVDNNTFINCTGHEGGYGNSAAQINQHRVIFRNNVCSKAAGFCGEIQHGSGDAQYAKDARIYNNVFYKAGEWSPYYKYGLWIYESVGDGDLTGIAIKNNIFYNNPNGDILYSGSTNAGEHTVANNHMATDGDPQFVDPDNDDFTLQQFSPCINSGGWLTLTNGTGTASTTLVVDDSWYFTDGMGIVTGDTIQFEGQETTATITAINYDTHTLTIDPAHTWADGVGVSLPYTGSAPDQGTSNYEGSDPGPGPEPGGTETIGSTEEYADACANDYIFYHGPYTTTYGGQLTKISAYVGSDNNGVFKCAIYSDNAGAPNALVADTTSAEVDPPTANAWNDAVVADGATLAASTSYWIALFVGTDGMDIARRNVGGTGPDRIYEAEAYNGFPANATSQYSMSNECAGLYATLDRGGGEGVQMADVISFGTNF